MVCPVPLGKKEDCGERYCFSAERYYASGLTSNIGRRVDTSAGAVTTTSLDLSLWRNYAVALASPSHVCHVTCHTSTPRVVH